VLLYFGLDCILYTRSIIQRTIDVSPAFLEHGLGERSQFDPNKQEVGFIFA
jgi:hypothetical protein